MEAHRFEVLGNEAATQANRESAIISDRSGVIGVVFRVVTANLAGTTAEYTPALVRVAADGSEDDVWEAAAAITAAGTNLYWIGPDAGGSAFVEAVQAPIPAYWKFILRVATADGSNNMDTEVDADALGIRL